MAAALDYDLRLPRAITDDAQELLTAYISRRSSSATGSRYVSAISPSVDAKATAALAARRRESASE